MPVRLLGRHLIALETLMRDAEARSAWGELIELADLRERTLDVRMAMIRAALKEQRRLEAAA